MQDIAAVKESDRRKDEFLALLGHELRGPLAAILNGVQALRMIEAGTSDAGQIQDLIERQANHMARLTDDLLDVSRISSGKIQLRKNWVELVEARTHTTDMHRRQMLHNRLQFEVRLPERPLWVHADATRLSQVVGNLLMSCDEVPPIWRQVTASSLKTSGDQATISGQRYGNRHGCRSAALALSSRSRKPIPASTAAAVAWASAGWSVVWSSGTGGQ